MRNSVAICALALLALTGHAQAVQDTSFIKVAFANTASLYEKFITIHSGLINGSEYKDLPYTETQYPFYLQNDWTTGDVVYNGQLYENVSLMFDITSGNVVAENPVNGQEIQLIKARVSRFNLGDHRFLNLKVEDNPGLPETAFYEVLYEGPSQVLVNHRKVFEEKIENSSLVFYYTPKSRIYVKSGDQYVRVARKGDLLKLFADRKSEVRSYIRQNKIRISRHDPESIAVVAAHYDTLKNTK